MKFERLTVPDWPLPDLVAFNSRVHEWVDPWWARRWVRLIAWAAAALFALFAAMWIYFASGLPSSQTLLAYQPPLPTNIRGYDGDAGPDLRPRAAGRAFLRRISAARGPRLHFGRGQGLLPAPRHRLHRPDRRRVRLRDKSVTGGGRATGGSTITQQVAKYLLKDSSYNVGRKVARGDPRLPARSHAHQAADPGAVSQLDLPWPQRLWRAGRRARLFRQGRQRADACPKPPISPSFPRRRPITIRCARRRRRSTAATMCCGRCTATATSPRTSGRRPRRPPLGTIRYGSNEKFRQQGGYFMEEVRRELIKQFGEDAKDGPNSLYAGGLWVRSSMDPKHAGCRGAGASRRSRQVRRRPRLERPRA